MPKQPVEPVIESSEEKLVKPVKPDEKKSEEVNKTTDPVEKTSEEPEKKPSVENQPVTKANANI